MRRLLGRLLRQSRRLLLDQVQVLDLVQDQVLDLVQDQVLDLVKDQVLDLVQDLVQDIFLMKIMEFDLKWVHMARYELILRLDGALWLTIIFKPLLTPKRAMKVKK